MKTCRHCDTPKDTECFRKAKAAKDGLHSWCRDCCREYDKQRGLKRYKTRNLGQPARKIIDGKVRCGKCNQWRRLENFAKYAKNVHGLQNKCCACQAEFDTTRNQKVRVKATQRWRVANRDKWNAYKREYQNRKNRECVQTLLSSRLRTRLSNAVRRQIGDKRAASAVRDLGCTLSELVSHLEARFTDGMSWDNYGEWHIDHIKPLAGFDLTDPDQARTVCHFTNLQPLWAADNLSKGARGG